MKELKQIHIIILIILLGAVLFIPFLGSIHLFDWDEVNFAEASREMLVTGDFLTVRIDYQPFHEKQPLFFWLQAISMKIFGINEFAARFPNAIIGIITLISIFIIGKNLFDTKFGLIWVFAYIGSFLPNFYFRTGLIDPSFNLFIFLGYFFIYKYLIQYELKNEIRIKYLLIASAFVSLSILTKGPVGYLLPFIGWVVYWFIKRKTIRFQLIAFIIFTSISFFPIIIWYIIILISNGWDLLINNINYQIRLLTTNDAGFSGPIFYHLVILLIGCYPASIFLIPSFKKQIDNNLEQSNFKIWLIILLGTVLSIFSLVQTKIVHYSSLAYFPITFLASYYIYKVINGQRKWKNWINIVLSIFGFFWALLMISIPIIGANIRSFIDKTNDNFAREVFLSDVNWSGMEYIIGIIYLLLIVISAYLFIKRKILKGYITITSSTAIVLFCYLIFVLPKVEQYIQSAPIEFFKSLEGKQCYIELLEVPNLRYSHYFYSRKTPSLSKHFNKNIPKDRYSQWLLDGRIDLPAYFVTKITEFEKYREQYKDINLIYTKNGYAFLVRYP